jgi:fluoride exporter
MTNDPPQDPATGGRPGEGDDPPTNPDISGDTPPSPGVEQVDTDVFARGHRRRHRTWDVLAVIAVGGGLGSAGRYGLTLALPTPPGGFPWATFITNVTGCLALGVLMVYVLDVWPPSRYVRPFLGVGFLGGYTTFSAYTVELFNLLDAGRITLANAYAVDSLAAGLLATWLGITAARLAVGIPVRRARPATADPAQEETEQ